jgi:hypothetical protein
MLGAQAEPYYGMDKRYDSYGSHDNYGQDSYDKKPYGNDNYGQESYDKKPYGNDNYGQDYPSYKPVYKKDPYGKDRDNDKSKDSSSVSIKKLKCNNINLNLNSIDATFGSPSNDTDSGATEVLAAAGGDPTVAANGLMNGNNGGRDGDRSFVDKENNFAFVCINNNNNSGAGGNATDGNDTKTCEDCFLDALGTAGLNNLTTYLGTLEPPAATNLDEYCELIASEIAQGFTPVELAAAINNDLEGAEIVLTDAELEALVACLFDVFSD